MTAVNRSSLNQYAEHLFDLLHLLRIYKSEKVFSLLARFSTGILIIICVVANLVLVISELIGLKDAKNVKQLARGIGLVSFHTTGIVKWCYCMWKIDIITSLINMLHNCHYLSLQICQNVRDREKLHKEMQLACKITSIFAYYWPPIGIGAALHYCFNPISFRLYRIYIEKHDSAAIPKILPLDGWFPWDQEHAKVTGIARFEERLKNCAVQHAKILKYVKELEDVGSPCMFVQCVQNIVILCLCSFEAATLQITSDADCVVNILNLLEFCSGVTVQLFFFCYIASYISSLGLDIAEAAYASQWASSFDALKSKKRYNRRNHKVKYSVLMITTRAQIPILLTGGPFYILSLQTFKSIVGMAVSNAVILSQVYGEK
ncbi:uncharacterized protein LOC117172863 isoform X2 [Belonocnema kinseyi]|uniref:uncharacterized protein LOC117172863 isoform X2 n=1 Tax=Belonocnema kinseyi TaxID=2817044 RepID=UPI00143DF8AF|nr:uncharacterized protein LOC117172863 isoform X2 [Belonocnema kinseyi]